MEVQAGEEPGGQTLHMLILKVPRPSYCSVVIVLVTRALFSLGEIALLGNASVPY